MSRHPFRRSRAARTCLALLCPTLLIGTTLAIASVPSVIAAPSDAPVVLERLPGEEPQVVQVKIPDTAELDRLVDTGVDLDHGVEQHEDHLHVRAVVTDNEIAALEAGGFVIGDTLYTIEDSARALEEREAFLDDARRENREMRRAARSSANGTLADGATHPDVSDVKIIRADYYTAFGQGMLSVEAKWAEGPNVSTALTVERDSGPGTPFGSGGTQSISRFVDAGVYLYHRGAAAVMVDERGGAGSLPVRPDRVRITSQSGDVAIAKVRDWLPTGSEKDPFKGPGYQEDFVSTYLSSTELYGRIKQLAATYPDLAEIVELPNKSNGYRRKAMALLEPSSRIESSLGDLDITFAASGAWAALTPVAPAPAVAAPVRVPSVDGCYPTGNLSGAVVVVDRKSTCPAFLGQVVAAQDAGAAAVLLVNPTTGIASAPSGSPTGVTIPVAGISRADAHKLRNGGAVTGRLIAESAPPNDARVAVETLAWGHEGGNDVTMEIADPAAASSPLSVAVTGSHVRVNARTDASGAIISTASEVVAALRNDAAASALVHSLTFRGSAGNGVVRATPVIRLSDHLAAPGSVSRDPHPVYAIKIGKQRDGSKPGVLLYAQEHAREWVPPLTTIEAAERLLRNYETHEGTRDLVDNLEIWVAPSINPDGSHYSFYDFATQRRNLMRYCPETSAFDVLARNAWGVDLNRNYEMYSGHDGYSGGNPVNPATGSQCTSDTNGGPEELSEPEARNVDWMMAHPNMKFSMNMHSSGNYFMWAPGTYKTPGREPAPRPTVEEEQFFWEASEKILTGIKRHRGLSVTPARTGPIIDVLYSAAGNSGDQAWYKYGIYGWSFEVGSTFQPPFRTTPDAPNAPNAHDETMEYGNGLIELVRVARDLDADVTPPETAVTVTETEPVSGQVNVTFESNEAAAIYYTTDGSRPTLASTKVEQAAVRESFETIKVDEGSKVYWFSVDQAGNVEGHYDPENEADQRYRKWIASVDWQPSVASSSVSLSVLPTSLKTGESATADVEVAAAANDFGLAPSGVVTVTAGGEVVGEVALDASGKGTVPTSAFEKPGTYQVSASYAGDDLTAGSTSEPVTVRVVGPPVGRVPSKIDKVKIRPAEVRRGERAKAVVRVAASGAPSLSGRVVIRHEGEVIARGGVNAKGRVVLRLKRFQTVGRQRITIAYKGTSTIQPSRTRKVVRVVR